MFDGLVERAGSGFVGPLTNLKSSAGSSVNELQKRCIQAKHLHCGLNVAGKFNLNQEDSISGDDEEVWLTEGLLTRQVLLVGYPLVVVRQPRPLGLEHLHHLLLVRHPLRWGSTQPRWLRDEARSVAQLG